MWLPTSLSAPAIKCTFPFLLLSLEPLSKGLKGICVVLSFSRPVLLYSPSLSLEQVRAVCDCGARAINFHELFLVLAFTWDFRNNHSFPASLLSVAHCVMPSCPHSFKQLNLPWFISFAPENVSSFNYGSLIGLGNKILHQNYLTPPAFY